MNITLNNESYPVYKPKLVLETDSCPKLELWFGLGEKPTVEQQIKFINSNANLSWEGGQLTLQIVGFEENNTDNQNQLIITCVVLPDLLSAWFQDGGERENPLIYQKNEITAPETGAEFFTRLLGHKVLLSEEEKSLLNQILPEFATFVQAPKQDNFSFIGHLIDFIRSQQPSIKGWAAFQSDATPLRLVSTTSSKPVKLDEQWTPRRRFPTHRYAGKTWAQQPFELIRRFPISQPLILLPELVKKGQQKPDEIQCGEMNENDKNQLIMIPGRIIFQDQEYFCQTITYQFTEKPDEPEFPDISAVLTVTELDSSPTASPFGWQMVNGHFQDWEEGAKELKYINLKLESGSVANSEGQADTSKPLYAQVLSPTPPRSDEHGFYFKYQQDDSMCCLLIPGNLPTVLGGIQLYNETFESQADLVIQAKHIAMTSSQVTIEAAEEVHIKGNQRVKMGNKLEVGSD